MKRLLVILLTLLVLALGLYLFDQYWIHRFDALITRESALHHVDPDLVWSIAYEESYFRTWKKGRDGEIGIMQVTPNVAQDWISTQSSPTQAASANDPTILLQEPERNVQIACWYLQRSEEEYRDVPGREARMLAAYNAGPKRAAEWNKVDNGAPSLDEQQFIARIDIASTRAYVTSILQRYNRVKASKSIAGASAR